MRPFISHGTGEIDRAAFARLGTNVIFEPGAMAFHCERIALAAFGAESARLPPPEKQMPVSVELYGQLGSSSSGNFDWAGWLIGQMRAL